MKLRVGYAMCLLAVHLANLVLANLVPFRRPCGSQGKECEAEASGMLALSLDRMTRGHEIVGAGVNFTCSEACSVLGGVCRNSSAACAERRGFATAPWLCHCEVEKAPVKDSKLQRIVQTNSLLRENPFIMTHDSATGFMGRYDVRDLVAQSQTIDLVEQLTCGARSLDIRLVVDEDETVIYFHHGSGMVSWVSKQTLQGEWPKLAQWARDHPEELVVLVISHCQVRQGWFHWQSSKCSEDRWIKEVKRLGLTFETNCKTLSSMTMGEAMKKSRLADGGHMLAVDGACVQDNWDPDITSAERVKPYVEKTMKEMHAQHEKTLFQVQSFIQQQMLVPLNSSLNQAILSWITTSKLYAGVNLLEINLMCAYGASMASALGYTISSEDYQTCRSNCHLACQRHGACEQL